MTNDAFVFPEAFQLDVNEAEYLNGAAQVRLFNMYNTL